MQRIDEQALGAAAGWKAMKEGRALVAAGAVEGVSSSAGKLSGVVAEGGRRRRVSLVIRSASEIETRCGCPHNAGSGALCAHAVAVALASIAGAQPQVAAKVAENAREPAKPERGKETKVPAGAEPVVAAVPVSLHFPPDLAAGLARGRLTVGLKVLAGGELVPGDVALAGWLAGRGVVKVPAALALAGGELVELLDLLAGHPRVFLGTGRPLVLAGVGRVDVECVEEPGRVGFRHRADGEVLVPGAGTVWCWQADGARLAHAAAGGPGDGFWRDLAAGRLAWLAIDVALRHHGWLQDSLRTEDDSWVERLSFRPADCRVVLGLDGGLKGVVGTLEFVYGEDGKVIPTNSLPTISISSSALCLTRSPEFEDQVARRLAAAGFVRAGGAGEWRLAGEDAVLGFLGDVLPRLRSDWDVRVGARLASQLGQLEVVRPQVRLSGSGEDWLAMDFEFLSESGSRIDKEQVRRLLRTGQRRLRLPGGRQAVIAAEAVDLLEAVIFDVDPRQEGGRFLVPAAQEGYLRELQRTLEPHAPAEPPQLSDDDARVLGPLASQLRPYQREGVAWLRERARTHGAALLADDMGLGKTLQTLAWLRLQRASHPGPALIVCPTSLLGNWQAEAEKFTAEARVLVLHGQGRQQRRESLAEMDLVLTSYGSLVRDLEFYRDKRFAAVVLDEASVIRNPDAEVSKAVAQLKADVRVALTGTPIENGVRDLWAVFRFLMPGYLGARTDFRERYELPLARGNGDPGILRRLRMRAAPFFLRRTKAEVARDLPSKVECLEWCALSAGQRGVYASVLREAQEIVAEVRKSGGAAAARMKTLTTLLRLRQACCDLALLDGKLASQPPAERSGKLERLIEIVGEALKGGKKLLVFSQFATMLGHIRTQLDALGIASCYLDGSTRDRTGEVARFQSPDGPPVFLISLKAGGYGLNLTAAEIVVHFDPWWNPAVEAQATDRAHRIGQTKPITVYKLISRGTVEEKVLNLQRRKRVLSEDALDERGLLEARGLGEEELLELISS